MLNKAQLLLLWWQHDWFSIVTLITYTSEHQLFIQEEKDWVYYLACAMEQASAKHLMFKCTVWEGFFHSFLLPRRKQTMRFSHGLLVTQNNFRNSDQLGFLFKFEMTGNWNFSPIEEFDTSESRPFIKTSGVLVKFLPLKKSLTFDIFLASVLKQRKWDLWERKFNFWWCQTIINNTAEIWCPPKELEDREKCGQATTLRSFN